MANNCLVTNLKGAVNDSTLPKLGEVRVYATSEVLFRANYSGAYRKVRTVDGTITYKGNTSKEVTPTDTSIITFAAGAYYFIELPYGSLYNITLSCDNKDAECDYSSILLPRTFTTNIILNGIRNELGLFDIEKVGDNFDGITNELTLNYCSDIVGDIRNFRNLKTPYLSIVGTGIEGNLEDMLNGYISRATPITAVEIVANGKVKFDGATLNSEWDYHFTYSNSEWTYTVS